MESIFLNFLSSYSQQRSKFQDFLSSYSYWNFLHELVFIDFLLFTHFLKDIFPHCSRVNCSFFIKNCCWKVKWKQPLPQQHPKVGFKVFSYCTCIVMLIGFREYVFVSVQTSGMWTHRCAHTQTLKLNITSYWKFVRIPRITTGISIPNIQPHLRLRAGKDIEC